MEIIVDDLTGPEIAEFIEEHIEEMKAVTLSPESKHALDLDGLRVPEVTFWTMIEDGEILGVRCDQAARPRPCRDQVDARRADAPTARAGFGAPSTHHRRVQADGDLAPVARDRVVRVLRAGSTPLSQARLRALRSFRRLRSRSQQRLHDQDLVTARRCQAVWDDAREHPERGARRPRAAPRSRLLRDQPGLCQRRCGCARSRIRATTSGGFSTRLGSRRASSIRTSSTSCSVSASG